MGSDAQLAVEDSELAVRPTLVRLERASPVPCGALRLTGWVERVRNDKVAFIARAHDGNNVLRCEATIELAPCEAAATIAMAQPVLMRA